MKKKAIRHCPRVVRFVATLVATGRTFFWSATF
jgi:hypothetical protein